MHYFHGEGVENIDKKAAVTWITAAATQGEAAAQNKLGQCYLDGDGVDANKKDAAMWFAAAAEQRYAKAQYNLGVCYRDGVGLPRDLIKAVEWVTKSAEQGNEDAQDQLPTTIQLLQSNQKLINLYVAIDIVNEPNFERDKSSINELLTAFQQIHFIDSITFPHNGILEKFTATLKRAIAPYQDDDFSTIEQNHQAIFEELNESKFFSILSDTELQRNASEWARRLQRDTTLVDDVNEIILGYLGTCREDATELLDQKPAAFELGGISQYLKKTVSTENSFRIKFTTKESRDSFVQNEDNQHLFDRLRWEEKNITIDSAIGSKFKKGWSVKLTYPNRVSEGFNQTLTELKHSLLPKPQAASHVARLEASSPSSRSSLNR